jgi:hypothetical protein
MNRALPLLELDFRRARRAAPWAGPVLLALAVLFAADLGHTWQAGRESLAAAEARLAKLGRSPDRHPGMRMRAATPEEIAAAKETYQRLAMPWEELFGALETAATERVMLTAIEPDAKSGTVTVSGEGKNYAAVLDYVVRLREAGTLARPHLVKHEVRGDGPQAGVGFSVTATWGEVRR